MIYPISILHETINVHRIRIKVLENMEHEMQASEIFADEEITERLEYISQLETAINILRK